MALKSSKRNPNSAPFGGFEGCKTLIVTTLFCASAILGCFYFAEAAATKANAISAALAQAEQELKTACTDKSGSFVAMKSNHNIKVTTGYLCFSGATVLFSIANAFSDEAQKITGIPAPR